MNKNPIVATRWNYQFRVYQKSYYEQPYLIGMNAFKKEEGPKNRVINVLYYLQITYGHIIPTLNAPKGLNQMIKHTQ